MHDKVQQYFDQTMHNRDGMPADLQSDPLLCGLSLPFDTQAAQTSASDRGSC